MTGHAANPPADPTKRSLLRMAWCLAAGLSAALFVVAVIFWVRSYSVFDDPVLEGQRWYMLETVPGAFQFEMRSRYRNVGNDHYELEPSADHWRFVPGFSEGPPYWSPLKHEFVGFG